MVKEDSKTKAMDSMEIVKQYNDKLQQFKQLKDEVIFTIEEEVNKTKIKVHSIISRIKSLHSLEDKFKRKGGVGHLGDIYDIVGIRIVCLFLSDIEKIKKIILDSFEVVSEDNKLKENSLSTFGYMSVHFICTLKKEHSGPRYNNIKNITFEIQVRTIAMDAWATISHYLDYKKEEDIPNELKRDFYALSGLFYVADSHFEIFFKASEDSARKVEKLFKKPSEYLDQGINLDTLREYFKKKFPDREHAKPSDLSEIISELSRIGITTIGQLDADTNKAMKAFLAWEEERPPGSRKGRKFIDVGVVRGVYDLLNPAYRSKRRQKPPNYILEMIKK